MCVTASHKLSHRTFEAHTHCTHTHTHTHTHTARTHYTHSLYTHTHTLSFRRSLTWLSLTHTLHTRTHTLSLSHTARTPYTHSLYTHSLSLSEAPSLVTFSTVTHTHAHSHAYTHAHTHTRTHTRTHHTHTLHYTYTHAQSLSFKNNLLSLLTNYCQESQPRKVAPSKYKKHPKKKNIHSLFLLQESISSTTLSFCWLVIVRSHSLRRLTHPKKT